MAKGQEAVQEVKSAEKPVRTLEVVVNTEAQHPFFTLAVPVGTTVEDAIGQVAEAAQKARVKGGAAFGRMVNEAYQVRHADSKRVVDPTSSISGEPKHYLVSAAGENGTYQF